MISKGFLQSESKNRNRWKSLKNHKYLKLTSPRLRNYHHRFYHKLNAWREEKNHLKWVKSKDSSANKKKRTNSLSKGKKLLKWNKKFKIHKPRNKNLKSYKKILNNMTINSEKIPKMCRYNF